MKERIQKLEKIFVQWYCSSDRDTFAGLVGVPPGMAPAVLAFRGEIQHSRLGGEKEVSDDSKEIPTDEAYLTAVRDVRGVRTAPLAGVPRGAGQAAQGVGA